MGSPILEAEIWCPSCKLYAGRAWREEIRDGIWEHYTDPEVVPKYCSLCEGVLVRK